MYTIYATNEFKNDHGSQRLDIIRPIWLTPGYPFETWCYFESARIRLRRSVAARTGGRCFSRRLSAFLKHKNEAMKRNACSHKCKRNFSNSHRRAENKYLETHRRANACRRASSACTAFWQSFGAPAFASFKYAASMVKNEFGIMKLCEKWSYVHPTIR